MYKTLNWVAVAVVLSLACAPGAEPAVAARESGRVEPQLAAGLAPIGGVRFLHIVTKANVFAIGTYLHHPLLDGNPSAIVLATQVWNPLGMSGVYNDHPTGVIYDPKSEAWAIYNEDATSMPLGAGFHVLIVPPGPTGAVLTSDKSNTAYNYTDFDYAPLNGDATAHVFVTHSNKDASKGELLAYPIGVWDDSGYWSVFVEAKYFLGLGFDFNLAFGPDGDDSYTHIASAGNSAFNETVLDHSDLNGKPRAWVMVTHNQSPYLPSLSGGETTGLAGEAAAVYVLDNVGVYYNGKLNKWSIFDQDGTTAIPEGAAFNVLVDPHPSIFMDDFESDGTTFWSSVTP